MRRRESRRESRPLVLQGFVPIGRTMTCPAVAARICPRSGMFLFRFEDRRACGFVHSRSGSIAKEAKALAVAWASVRECHQKRVRGPGPPRSTKSARLECRQSPCRHHQQDRGSAAFPAAPALAATFRRQRTPCSSHLPRHASSICAGPPCMPVSSSKLLMGQWEHASQHKPGGRVTSGGPVFGNVP